MATTTSDAGIPYEIRPLEEAELWACPPLSGKRFGFTELDQVPPWVLRTWQWCGGFVLGAFDMGRLIGYSMSYPGVDNGRTFLMASGLAVEKEFESQGVGFALKLRQRELALAAGYDVIRWTTAALASRQLYVYLTKLGARLVDLVPDMYVETLRFPFQDEVILEWDLQAFPPRREQVPERETLTRTEPAGEGWRRLVSAELPAAGADDSVSYLVELPWDRERLMHEAQGTAREWSDPVGRIMEALLGAGHVGVDVLVDRAEERSFVEFARVV